MQTNTLLIRRLWRNLPNALSIVRLGASGVLLIFIRQHRPELFTWVLLAALFSDVLDGLIARAFRLTSRLGASLDSLADIATMFFALLGVFEFQPHFVKEHGLGIWLVFSFYLAEIAASMWRYGRISSFHTVLARIAAFIAGIFVMSLFLFGSQTWLYHETVLIYVAALSEEMLLIWLLPEWQADVSGICWVLAARTKSVQGEDGLLSNLAVTRQPVDREQTV